MVELRLNAETLGRARFGYSPLTELIASLRALRYPPPLHRYWWHTVHNSLCRADLALLAALVPFGAVHADFLLDVKGGDPTTTIDDQLDSVGKLTGTQITNGLEQMWFGGTMPASARELIAMGEEAGKVLADGMRRYWRLTLEPHWPRIRAVLDDDVEHRARRLTRRGMSSVFTELHPELKLHGNTLRINKPTVAPGLVCAQVVTLVPSVFVWSQLVTRVRANGSLDLIYGARSIDRVWPRSNEQISGDQTSGDQTSGDGALGSLLGRSRATILAHLDLPKSTTQLSRELGQSPPAISQHLSVMRRAGLVTSWRSGREVLYRRTALGSTLISRSDTAGRSSAHTVDRTTETLNEAECQRSRCSLSLSSDVPALRSYVKAAEGERCDRLALDSTQVQLGTDRVSSPRPFRADREMRSGAI